MWGWLQHVLNQTSFSIKSKLLQSEQTALLQAHFGSKQLLPSVTFLVSLGCIVNNEAQGDQHPWTYQNQEAHHRTLAQDVAATAGRCQTGTQLWLCSLNWEAVMLDDVAIVGKRGFDNDFLVDLAIQAEPRVSLIVQGIGKVTLQVYTIQSVCCGGQRRKGSMLDIESSFGCFL